MLLLLLFVFYSFAIISSYSVDTLAINSRLCFTAISIYHIIFDLSSKFFHFSQKGYHTTQKYVFIHCFKHSFLYLLNVRTVVMVFLAVAVCETVEVGSSPSSVFKTHSNPDFTHFVRLIPR